jgi:hypothetical protein
MPPILDRAGQRFGHLLVVAEQGRDRQGRATWWCRCDCGTEKSVPSRHLGSGAVVSCGCYGRASSAENGRKGGFKLRGAASPLHRQTVGYGAVHVRLRTERGAATLFECVDCGSPAQHWSYDLDDPNELIAAAGHRYSLDPAHYEPRCVKCHSAYDRAAQR